MKKKPELTIEEAAHRTRIRDMYCGVFVVTSLVWALRFVFEWILGFLSTENYYLITALQIFTGAFSVFLPFFIFLKAYRDPLLPILKDSPRSEHPVLRCAIGCFSVFGLTIGALGLMELLRSLLEGAGLHSNVVPPDLGNTWQETLFYLLFSTVCYSLAYEISFRGIALRTMKEENRLTAVLVSGIAFALCDGDLYRMAVRFAIGFLLGFFYLRIRSVWCCIALQAVSQITISLWWLFVGGREFTLYVHFLILMGLVIGIAAALFLFYPRRESDPQTTSNKVALKEAFTSFGVYLMIGLVAFNLLIFTFSTDGDPNDPLLQPMDEEQIVPPLQFDRDNQFQEYDPNTEYKNNP